MTREKVFKVKELGLQAVRQVSNCGPIFGNDIYISDNCDKNTKSLSNFGQMYETPEDIEFGEDSARTYLAGSFTFKVEEIEVYSFVNFYNLII